MFQFCGCVIVEVTLKGGSTWQGAAASFDAAALVACKAYGAPSRSIESVRIVKIID